LARKEAVSPARASSGSDAWYRRSSPSAFTATAIHSSDRSSGRRLVDAQRSPSRRQPRGSCSSASRHARVRSSTQSIVRPASGAEAEAPNSPIVFGLLAHTTALRNATRSSKWMPRLPPSSQQDLRLPVSNGTAGTARGVAMASSNVQTPPTAGRHGAGAHQRSVLTRSPLRRAEPMARPTRPIRRRSRRERLVP